MNYERILQLAAAMGYTNAAIQVRKYDETDPATEWHASLQHKRMEASACGTTAEASVSALLSEVEKMLRRRISETNDSARAMSMVLEYSGREPT